ncbi:hypothetical protein LCGC14_1366870 [marine sediment metagenome]|uniref:DUF3880 domain-containing protein n=2 Tax=root TaxID=1 RepID=A0A0F9KSH0_9ZZZZ|nr:MAG: hypothetical protein LCMAC202_04060 [Marseillevirus LCMAC202]
MSQKKIIYYCQRKGHECFEDYIDSLGIVNRKVYYTDDTELDRKLFADSGNVHIFRYHFPQFLLRSGSKNAFVLNTEQMSEDVRRNHIIALMNSGVKIIDYSIANIKILSRCSNSSLLFYLPYQYQDAEVNRLRQFSIKTEYDVGIVHCITAHRKKILHQLCSAGLKAIDIRGWKDKRDRLIGKCKILLNVHYDQNFHIFEHIRCDRWVFAGKPLMSEQSNNIEMLDIRSNVHFYQASHVIDAVRWYLKETKNLLAPEIIQNRRRCLQNFITHVNEI